MNQKQGRLVMTTGTRVRVGFVDMYGFCGREFHPVPDDVGRVGTLVELTEHGLADGSRQGDRLEVYDGMLLADDEYCVYVVDFANDRRLEMVDHELEVLAAV